MTSIAWLVAGYLIGAYLMRRHMLRSIRETVRREVARAEGEYEGALVRRIRGRCEIEKA